MAVSLKFAAGVSSKTGDELIDIIKSLGADDARIGLIAGSKAETAGRG